MQRRVIFEISIHAPREGGDVSGHHGGVRPYHFNPRPPRGGRRHCLSKEMASPAFQSTPPARGATIARGQRGGCTADKAVFQSTPPARGATVFDGPLVGFGDISIHAPREGGDISVAFMLFLLDISIHAPREGGDYHTIKKKSRIFNFNPRPPRGGRLLCGHLHIVL